ncbi:MAG: glycosyltransferase [Candidatus Krumholzibacteria bacterium]|nr:glycosyltransferase [Candidatus Krumholzibacteria bacterium]
MKPLRVVFAPKIYNALSDWRIHTRACTEEFWVATCGAWSAYEEFPASWVTDLPAKWNHVPPTSPLAKPQFRDIEGKAMEPGELKYYKGKLNNHRCGPLDIYICWNDAEWITTLPALAKQPYLCRDRFWVVAGKSQILPQGFSQEITTSITQGVEKTECDEFSVSMTVEGEVSDGFNSLKTTIEASYTKTVTKSVFQQTSVETRYTPEPVPAGKQAVYQVWVLVDRYTITDKNGNRSPIQTTRLVPASGFTCRAFGKRTPSRTSPTRPWRQRRRANSGASGARAQISAATPTSRPRKRPGEHAMPGPGQAAILPAVRSPDPLHAGRPLISAVLITRDEERNIARCLRSVAPFAAETLVVDSGSTDATVEIAAGLGARVLHNPWPGFGPQKRFAVEHASHDWVFSIDADEEVSPALAAEIAALDFSKNAYQVPRTVHYLGRWIRHGIWYPGYVTRLFRRDRGAFTGDAIHESVRVDGPVGRLRNDLLHYSYRDVDHHLEKMNEFTSLSAQKMFAEGRRASMFRLALQPGLEFLRSYVARGGILDGYPGLVIALFHAYYVFLKYAKLRELCMHPERA